MPYPLFPAPGGLLAWGGNFNSDHFFWLTNSVDPDDWPVVWFQNSSRRWHRYSGRRETESAAALDRRSEQPVRGRGRAAGQALRESDERGMAAFLLTAIWDEAHYSISSPHEEAPYWIRTSDYERGYRGCGV
ncbi:hypothetical protein [Streptomyces nanshensis]|uniref:hypothetical protein n=1 Tax=Streptomyces nanshensis TaxID=518642 RepID=UPI00114CBB45|nr:hypothetical protein [Streptomyces nanshensis]